MEVIQFETKDSMGKAAAEKGAGLISKAIQEKGGASIILATGASQFEMLGELVSDVLGDQHGGQLRLLDLLDVHPRLG